MSRYALKPAKREQISLYIAIVAPSDGGKTKSALRLAEGIQSVVGGDIAFIDSENKRALQYADEHNFLHMDLKPPFNPKSILEAVQFCVEQGAKTVIVDSMSLEHEGEGGYLDMQEKELQRMAGDDWKKRESCKMAAWIKPAGERRLLITRLWQMDVNLILCFRAKNTVEMTKDERTGKTKFVNAGLQPIGGSEIVYTMTHRFLLPPGAHGVPDFSAETCAGGVPKCSDEHKRYLDGRPLDEEAGAFLARWAQGGDPRSKLIRKIESAAMQRGGQGFKTEWDKLSQEDKAIIGREERDRIIQVAKETDAALQAVTTPTKETLLSRIQGVQNNDVLDIIAEDANGLDGEEKDEVLAAISEARKGL